MNVESDEILVSDRSEGKRTIAPVVVLLGPPGSGKGTQAKRMSERYGLPHISTGEMLREIARRDTPLGREISAIQKAGGLVGDAVLARLLSDRTLEPDCRNGYILDGYPRTLAQAALLETLTDDERPILALALVLPTE